MKYFELGKDVREVNEPAPIRTLGKSFTSGILLAIITMVILVTSLPQTPHGQVDPAYVWILWLPWILLILVPAGLSATSAARRKGFRRGLAQQRIIAVGEDLVKYWDAALEANQLTGIFALAQQGMLIDELGRITHGYEQSLPDDTATRKWFFDEGKRRIDEEVDALIDQRYLEWQQNRLALGASVDTPRPKYVKPATEAKPKNDGNPPAVSS